MRVLLVNPLSELARQSNAYSRSVTALPPLGLAYLSAALKRNNVEVFIEDQYATRISNDDLIKKIKHISPEVVGISCLTTAMGNAARLIKQIKQANPQTTVILGNIHPTLFPEETLKKEIGDIVIRGEGEEALQETIAALSRGNGLEEIKGISYIHKGECRHNPDRGIIDDLDSLPYPDWHSLDLRHYKRYPMLGIYNKLILAVQGSRGCPYNCLFCSQDKFYKKPRYRDVKKIVNEIEYLYEKFRVDYIGFVDAYFPFSKTSGLEFCDEFMRRKLHKKIKWITEMRVDSVDLELMRRMKESGLELIMYGFEVGDARILDSIGKKATLSQARQAMEYTKKCKIRSIGLFMLGLPEDTKETCSETIRFAKELDPDICKFNIAVPFPGSIFFDQLKSQISDIDNINDKFTSWYDWSSYDGGIIYSPKDITKKELLDLQRKGMFAFYMRPKVIFKHLLGRTFSLADICYGAWLLIRNYLKVFYGKPGGIKTSE